jgi:hypothetical protein
MKPNHMPVLARLIARVLVAHEAPERVLRDVMDLRSWFQSLHFMRLED